MTNVLVSFIDIIPTNTLAFQQYALGILLTQATVFVNQWHLDVPTPITTNMVTSFGTIPRTNSWGAGFTLSNRYSFLVSGGSFESFHDKKYYANSFVGNDEASDAMAQMTNHLTLDSALQVARHALHQVGIDEKELGLGEPAKLKQWQYDSNGVMYPLPLYAVRWETKEGVVDMEISGVTSNVARFFQMTRAKSMRVPMPTNYLEMLGLPRDTVFVREMRKPPGIRDKPTEKKIAPQTEPVRK